MWYSNCWGNKVITKKGDDKILVKSGRVIEWKQSGPKVPLPGCQLPQIKKVSIPTRDKFDNKEKAQLNIICVVCHRKRFSNTNYDKSSERKCEREGLETSESPIELSPTKSLSPEPAVLAPCGNWAKLVTSPDYICFVSCPFFQLLTRKEKKKLNASGSGRNPK